MTDTSREAVEDLIAECRDVEGTNAWYEEVANTLAALLDERDEALRSNKNLRRISNANGDWSEKYQASLTRERHAQADALKAEFRAEAAEQRIRDLEAGLSGMRSNASLFARQRDREMAEHDRLAEKLDAVKAVVTGWNGFTGLTREVLAILADTDEGNEK